MWGMIRNGSSWLMLCILGAFNHALEEMYAVRTAHQWDQQYAFNSSEVKLMQSFRSVVVSVQVIGSLDSI